MLIDLTDSLFDELLTLPYEERSIHYPFKGELFIGVLAIIDNKHVLVDTTTKNKLYLSKESLLREGKLIPTENRKQKMAIKAAMNNSFE